MAPIPSKAAPKFDPNEMNQLFDLASDRDHVPQDPASEDTVAPMAAAASLDQLLSTVPADEEQPVGNPSPEDGINPFKPDDVDPTKAQAIQAAMNIIDSQESYGEPGDLADNVADPGKQAAHPRSVTQHPVNAIPGTKSASSELTKDPEPDAFDGTNFRQGSLRKAAIAIHAMFKEGKLTAAEMQEAFDNIEAADHEAAPKFDPNEMNELFNLGQQTADEAAEPGATDPADDAPMHMSADMLGQMLKGKVVVLAGNPPSPLKKKEVADLLKSEYGVAKVDPIFTDKSQVVVYDHRNQQAAQQAKSSGIATLPYEALVA